MDYIVKPRRVTAENTRSRGAKAVDQRSDSKREASPRLYDFASVVGGRRAELGALRKNDLVLDESGCWCVRIKRGKGGKYQEQRVLPDDVNFVKSFFDGSSDFVFSKKEMTNKIDLHHLRALQAQRAYQYYAEQIKDESFRMKSTADRLGHSEAVLLRKYAHSNPDSIRKAGQASRDALKKAQNA